MPTQHTSLAGKRILVTGGTTGIGRATVMLLAGEGAKVLTFGRHAPELKDALSSAAGSRGVVSGLTADIATREGLVRVYAKLDEWLGGIDVLICCAALGARPIHEMAEDEWRYVIETNLVGYLACARAAIARMRGCGGHLVFVSSISTHIKAAGESVYAATKAGVEAFAETLRKEVAEENIRISVIQPGSTATDMQQCSDRRKRAAIQREGMLHAEEVAEGILFALTRSPGTNVLNLRMEPRLQKTA